MRFLTSILALSLFLPLCGQEVTNALGVVVAEIETRILNPMEFLLEVEDGV